MGGLLLERLGWVRSQEVGSRVWLRRPLEDHDKELGPPLNARAWGVFQGRGGGGDVTRVSLPSSPATLPCTPAPPHPRPPPTPPPIPARHQLEEQERKAAPAGERRRQSLLGCDRRHPEPVCLSVCS